MKKKNTNHQPWHPIEFSIVRYVARYGVMTATALSVLRLKSVEDTNQAKDLLARLASKGDLIRHEQLRQEDCYTLSPKAIVQANTLGVESVSEVNSLEKLTRAYALLSVCCLQMEKRKLLTHTELTEHFPDLCPHGQATNYYLSRESGEIRLGFVRVDSGGRGRWDRVARKACDDMRKHLGICSLQPMLDKQRFEICVVTALPCKAKRIEDVLNTNRHLLNVPYRVMSIPSLINFIRPRPD